jgi:DNA (cytosine-5)-methyltransferase 1
VIIESSLFTGVEVRAVSESHYGVPLERSDYLKLDPHPNRCEPDQFAEWLQGYGKGRRLAVDLFSGAGGLSLGLQRAGWTTAAAVDFDERALETHGANFPGMSLHMDLGNPSERDRLERILEPARGKIDLVAGGPPCQPFSRAGRSKIRSLVERCGRDPEDLRKELWRAYLDVIKRIGPRAILMENVPDMGLGDDFRVVRIIEQQLEDLGYATEVRLVDAWRYGVPQHRKRLILLARNDIERFVWREDLPESERTTLQDAIGDLPVLPVEPRERIGGRVMAYTTPSSQRSPFAKIMRLPREDAQPQDTDTVVYDHMTRRVRGDDWLIFQRMTSRTLYSELEPELQRYSAKHFTDKYKKLAWNDLSRSITAHIAKDGYWYIHPDQNRTLTVREAARVQTFPDWFRFAGTRSDAFRQIGNAVPSFLGEAAAEVLAPVDARGVEEHEKLQPRWRTAREELTVWAEDQRQGRNWFHLPELPSLHAVLMAILSNTRVSDPQLRSMMETVIGQARLTRTALHSLIEAAPTNSVRARLERLTDVAGKRTVWERERCYDLLEQVELKPAEERLYKLLIGEDMLWVGQSALRVAARLRNSESDRVNRLSDGRVDLVKLVGAGDDAALRMAAVRLIGRTLCRVKEPLCDACPLAQYCAGRGSSDLFTDALSGSHGRGAIPAQSEAAASITVGKP